VNIAPPVKSLCLLALAMLVTVIVYLPSLNGGFVFDDFANIVSNDLIHIKHASLSELSGAVAGFRSSDVGRPLASLSFALNWLATGADPRPMKITNLVIHLINGLLIYAMLLELLRFRARTLDDGTCDEVAARRLALLVSTGWLLLPINLMAVAYVVQRMESLCQIFVLAGLWGYLRGRREMLTGRPREGFMIATTALVTGTAVGILVKESAALLPMYAFLAEVAVGRFCAADRKRDRRVICLFGLILFLPGVLATIWMLHRELAPDAWAGRPFTLTGRLLTEPRVLVDYLRWTLLPDPRVLSLYHDEIGVSSGWLSPPATLFSILALIALFALAVGQSRRRSLLALGILWFFAAHLLTATIVPLELVFEHRNYFASIGVLLAVFSVLAGETRVIALPIVRGAAIAILITLFAGVTALRSREWSNPVLLGFSEASRHPDSPRANYDLARLLVLGVDYRPSPQLDKARYYLRRAAALPNASSLPEFGLIMIADRSDHASKPELWQQFIGKLRNRPTSEEDISALIALTDCRRNGQCTVDVDQLQLAYDAALSHPDPDATLLGEYARFARDLRHDQPLALSYLRRAVKLAPDDPVYLVDMAALLAAQGDTEDALREIDELRRINTFGRLDSQIESLEKLAENPPANPGNWRFDATIPNTQ
jgi:hypothetical protein